MKKFELIEALRERREEVIAKHATTTDGITLKAFMMEVINIFNRNRVTTQNSFDRMFAMLLGEVAANHQMLYTSSDRDNAVRAKYAGTAFMAMV